MKKVIYTFALIIVLIWSCDSNDNDQDKPDPSNSDTILPTKVDIVYSDGETESIEYTYNNMRLIKQESSNGSYKDFIYNNNQLTEMNYYSTSNQNILESYTYDTQDRVATISTNIVGIGVYEYNLAYSSDGSVITVSSQTDSNASPSTITFNNGNIINFTEGNRYVYTYTYDTKNGVFKNLELRNQFISILSENNTPTAFSVNTLLNEHIEDQTNNETEDYTFTLTYTSFDYPRSIEENDDNDITTYTITYNND